MSEVDVDALYQRLRGLASDWEANGGSRPLGDSTADTWQKTARELLGVIDEAWGQQDGAPVLELGASLATDAPQPLRNSHEAVLVGGVSLVSSVVQVRDVSHPALTFRFVRGGGAPVQPITLVMQEADLEDTGRAVSNAAWGSVQACRQATGRDPKTGRPIS